MVIQTILGILHRQQKWILNEIKHFHVTATKTWYYSLVCVSWKRITGDSACPKRNSFANQMLFPCVDARSIQAMKSLSFGKKQKKSHHVNGQKITGKNVVLKEMYWKEIALVFDRIIKKHIVRVSGQMSDHDRAEY